VRSRICGNMRRCDTTPDCLSSSALPLRGGLMKVTPNPITARVVAVKTVKRLLGGRDGAGTVASQQYT